MTDQAKEKKTRRPWGEKRVPFLQHVVAQCRALGISKFDREKCLNVIKEQALRDVGTFLPDERKFHKQYVHTVGLKPRGQKMVLTQLGKVWGVKPKVVKKKAKPTPPPKKGPPPPPPNARAPKAPPPPPNAKSPKAPPPPPNARAPKAPPPPPNARAPKAPSPPKKVSMGEDLEEAWEEMFGKELPPIPEGMGQSVGTTYGPDKGREFLVEGHKAKVCISVRYLLPEHQALIVKQVQEAFEELESFGAALMNTKHSRRPDGLWADLLIHYSVGVVDLYKSVLSCDLVLDAEANPAARFGKTAQDVEAVGI